MLLGDLNQLLHGCCGGGATRSMQQQLTKDEQHKTQA
jgi:hypothetical protein